MTDLTEKLYATTDAAVWAHEWCRLAAEIEAADDDRHVIDEGWMITWFANAMHAQELLDNHQANQELINRVIQPHVKGAPPPSRYRWHTNDFHPPTNDQP